MIKIYLFLITFFVLLTNLVAQTNERHCPLNINESNYKDLIQSKGNTVTSRSGTKYIPVVFHIVYRTDEQNVSEAQIQSQLDALNNDFNKKNENREIIRNDDLAIEANLDIHFYLAETDESGRPTNGITRTKTDIRNIGDYYEDGDVKIKHDFLGGKDAWNPNRFLNVWVCETELLGFSSFPGANAFDEMGVVVNYASFGTIATDYKYDGYNGGHVLTHELGHFLGLLHIWGFEEECFYDDNIDDTPNQSIAYLECPFGTPSTCGSIDMTYNFMDYTPDNCIAMFTKGQKEVMLNTLEFYYPSLPTEQPDSVTPNDNFNILNQVTVYPTLVDNNLFVKGINDFEYQLIDTKGVVLKTENAHSNIIDLANLSSGVYYLVLKVEQTRKVTKFVKL